MNVKTHLQVVFFVYFAVLCREAHGVSATPYYSGTAERFRFFEWGGQTKESYVGTLLSWNLPELSLPTNGIGAHVRFTHGEDRDELQIYPMERGPYMLEIVARRCPDVLSAHWAVVSHFDSMQSTRDYSSATNDFGDRSYLTCNGAVFARNNIYVSVLSLTNMISAEAVARQIDADILRKSTGPGKLAWPVYGLIGIGLFLAGMMMACRKKTNSMSERFDSTLTKNAITKGSISNDQK